MVSLANSNVTVKIRNYSDEMKNIGLYGQIIGFYPKKRRLYVFEIVKNTYKRIYIRYCIK